MGRFQLGLARAATIILTLLFYTWLGVKLVVTLIGATTVADDYTLFVERLPAILQWLFSTPWWVPAILATILTTFLIWLSWPTKVAQVPSTSTSRHPAGQAPTKTLHSTDALVLRPTAPGPTVKEDPLAHNKIMLFCSDHLVPACQAQSKLQQAIIAAVATSGYVRMYAWNGAKEHQRSYGFLENFEKLEQATTGKISLSLQEIVDCVARLETMGYNTFCGQAHLMSQLKLGIKLQFDYKSSPETAPIWDVFKKKHNGMVTAYADIKRDARFGKLFKPSAPNEWGDLIP